MLDFFTKSVSKFFGTKSDRDLKTIQPIVEQILVEYPKLASLTNDQLRGKTTDFKKRIAEFSKEERNKVTEIRTKIDTDFSIDVETKEQMYNEIDELEKTIIKKNEEALNEILPEAFAVVKETARRLKELKSLEVTATDLDRKLAANRKGVKEKLRRWQQVKVKHW